jgi:hypothetical protein
VRAMRRPLVLTAAAALALAGCATVGLAPTPRLAATSHQKLEYYPFQVKGYQSSYPHRDVLVLTPVDDREFTDARTDDHAPLGADPAIGIVLNQQGNIIQRLYSDPLPGIVQGAIARSAEEAGMTAKTSPDTQYQAGQKLDDDYVIASRITRGWVIKRRGADGRYGPVWATAANLALEVTVYKPPFSVPFWKGTTNSNYNDPPVGSFGLGPEDEAGIYDEPGQVLSVALTRAVAGIFERPDFRTLVMQDDIRPR